MMSIEQDGATTASVKTWLPSETPFVIRPARPDDKDAVMAFCQRTYEWGDYVPVVWDEWLADEQGQLLVATLDGAPVGVAKVSLLTSTEAWLQGLRVHPGQRRKGLAGQLLLHCLDVARKCGAHVARLATSSSNVAVHKTTERAGMRRVAPVWILEAQALPVPGNIPALTCLTPQHWQEVSARLFSSATLAEMGGLYGMWDWQALTGPKLWAHLERGQVVGLLEDGQLVATAIISDVDEAEKYLAVSYAEGNGSHVQVLARALRNHAASLHFETVEVVVPSASLVHRAFLQAGYEPETESKAEIWIYELDLKGIAL